MHFLFIWNISSYYRLFKLHRVYCWHVFFRNWKDDELHFKLPCGQVFGFRRFGMYFLFIWYITSFYRLFKLHRVSGR